MSQKNGPKLHKLKTSAEVLQAEATLDSAAQAIKADMRAGNALVDTLRDAIFMVDATQVTTAKGRRTGRRYVSIGLRWLQNEDNLWLFKCASPSAAAFFLDIFEDMFLLTPALLSPEVLAMIDEFERELYVRTVAVRSITYFDYPNWVQNLVDAGIDRKVIAEIVLERLEACDLVNPGPTARYISEFLSPHRNDMRRSTPGSCSCGEDWPACTGFERANPEHLTQWTVLSDEQLVRALRICIGHKRYVNNVLGYDIDNTSLYDLLLKPRLLQNSRETTLYSGFMRDLLKVLPNLNRVGHPMTWYISAEDITEVLRHRTDVFGWAMKHAINLRDADLLDEMLTRHGQHADPKTVFTTYGHEADRWNVAAEKLLTYMLSRGFQAAEIVSNSTDSAEVRTEAGDITLTANCQQQPVGTTVLFHPEVRTPAPAYIGVSDTPYYTYIR